MIDTKPEFPQSAGEHHSTLSGYTVQAKFDFDSPQVIAGRVFDNRWRTVHFNPAPEGFGVPQGDRFNEEMHKHGLYGYESAQALRWWLHAVARAEGHEYCLMTRLIEHKVVIDTKITAERPCEERSYQRGMTDAADPSKQR